MKKFLYILLLILLSNCKPDERITACENPNLSFLVNENFATGNNYNYDALILNEGGYTYGNASINSWSINGSFNQNVYNSVNNYNIGDVLQSAYKTSDEIYLIVNNSQKIEVVDINNLQRKRTITGFTSPRFMTTISSFALVTDLYANKITVFNTETKCESNSIEMLGWTEQIFNIKDKIYVIERSEVGATSKFANLVEIEMNSTGKSTVFSIVKRTSIPIEPNSVLVDDFNNIWILSAGDASNNIPVSINKFSTVSHTIEKTKTFTQVSNIPERICIANNLTDIDLFYSAGQQIFSLKDESMANDFTITEVFTHTAQNLYSFSYVQQNQTFLICDAKDYISNGEILNYSNTGNLIQTMATGVIPGFILFK